MASRQEDRKKRLKSVCQSLYNRTIKDTNYLALHKSKLRSLIVNERYHFIYNMVYKVGSSNWSWMIVHDLEGYGDEAKVRLYAHEVLQRRIPIYDESQIKDFLKNYKIFIFVRNPLSRILSAYLDKFVRGRNEFYSNVAKNIIAKYRKGVNTNDVGIDVTFTEFINYLVDAEELYDGHWRPIYIENMPCEVSFDVIGKLEDANDDIPYTIKTIGLWNVTNYGKTPSGKAKASELLQTYYSQLPPKLLQQFYKVYEPDFHMFGYDMPLFI